MTDQILQYMRGLLGDSRGATAIEYGLIAALIAVVIIAAITLLGTDIGNTFNSVANNLSS